MFTLKQVFFFQQSHLSIRKKNRHLLRQGIIDPKEDEGICIQILQSLLACRQMLSTNFFTESFFSWRFVFTSSYKKLWR